jgi:tetratricopeptide (TPR) repeat protein
MQGRWFYFYSVGILCLGAFSSLGQEPISDSPADPKRLTSAEVMQREIERRREEVFTLNETLDLAGRLYRSGEWEQAKRKYELVLQQTQPEGYLAGFYRRAQTGAAQTLAAMALAKEKEGKLAESAGLMKQAADLDSRNPRVIKEAARLQEKAARQSDPFPDHPAATADLIAKTAKIKSQLALADQLTETGQYLEANAALEDVLRIDPYHRVARQKIEKLEDLRMSSANVRYQASRQKALAQVTEAWLPPPPAVIDPARKRSTTTARVSQAAEILDSGRGSRVAAAERAVRS